LKTIPRSDLPADRRASDSAPHHVLATGSASLQSVALTGLFLLALFHTLRVARDFFLPLVLAVLLTFLLRPLVRGLKRALLPEAAGAGLILMGLIGLLGLGVYTLADPAAEWMAKAPASMRRVEGKLKTLRWPVDQIGRTADQVEKSFAGESNAAQAAQATKPSFKEALLGGTQEFMSATVVVVVLLYFLLASGDLFLRKSVHALSTYHDKKRAVEIAREMESHISAYLLTVTLINLGVGLAVGTGVWLLGMPSPILWGTLAFMLTYVPYLGALVGIGILALASLLTFDHLGHALAVPGVYAVVAFLEGNFVTPSILGRRLTLNPVVIFVGLLFWFFLWGIPGALLAVPILATFKMICDHVEGLAPIGEFLGPEE